MKTDLACPQCDHSLGVPTAVGEMLIAIRPAPGDMSICVNCAAIIAFDGQPLAVRLADAADLAELPEELLDSLYLSRMAVQTYRHQHTP